KLFNHLSNMYKQFLWFLLHHHLFIIYMVKCYLRKGCINMAEPKMKENDNSVAAFIETVESEKKKADAYKLVEIFEEVTGFKAKMWGASIIGFGKYHYKYASGREGDAPLVGFSPRKAKISLYLDYANEERDKILEDFGKHTTSKACIY